jgi:hypothetical protein
MDLVVAVPFTLVIGAWFSKTWAGSEMGRHAVLAFGACVVAAWFIALRWLSPATPQGDAWRWTLAALTVGSSFAVQRYLEARVRIEHAAPERTDRTVAVLVLASGLAAVVSGLAIASGQSALFRWTMSIVWLAGFAFGSAIGHRHANPLRLFALTQVGLAPVAALTSWFVAAVPSLAGTLVLVPAAALMGVGSTALVKDGARPDVGRSMARLATSAMLGVATGAWLTGYVLVPLLGVTVSTWVPVLVHLCVGLVALRLSARPRPAGAAHASAPHPAALVTTLVAPANLIITVVAAALATVYLNLLRLVAASSAYATALFVSSIALGAAAGAAFARWSLEKRRPTPPHLALLAFALAATALIGVHAWSAIPGYFASFTGFPLVRTFPSRELVRFAVVASMLAPPAFCIGTLVPRTIDLFARAAPDPAFATARAMAFAAAGCLAGVAYDRPLIERLGPFRSIEILAVSALVLGLPPLFWIGASERRRTLLGAVPVLALLIALPTDFDEKGFASGAHVHFQPTPPRNASTTMSDDATHALLHTAARNDALVLGVEADASTAATRRAGFRHVDVVEPSEARRHLRRTATQYDLVSVTAKPLSLAGSSQIANREFYRLAKAKLRAGGVLAHGVELPELGADDVVSELATVRSEFAHVWLYRSGSQATMVACNEDCAPTRAALAAFGDGARLVAERILSPDAVDKLLADVAARGVGIEELVSTDDNLLLELDAPRSNVRDLEGTLKSNLTLLRSYAPPSLLDGTHLSEQDLAPEPTLPESAPVERPGLTRGARHGKTEP